MELIWMLVSRFLDWYKGWFPRAEFIQPLRFSSSISLTLLFRLGSMISIAYKLAFQTHLLMALPPSFAEGFKALCKWSHLQPCLLPLLHLPLPPIPKSN